ncbi:MAG: GIY-YIG nuclease family protein [Patescibacteria group bacterium]
MYYVYVLKSVVDDRIYIGQTGDLRRRFKEHQAGRDYTTKKYGGVCLIFYEAFYSKIDSIRREKYFKTSKGKVSLRLITRESMIHK